MEKIVLRKKEGKIEFINMDSSIEMVLDAKNKKHLCWGDCSETFCKNADTNRCPKVHDKEKKTIDKYGFITDGVQTLSENGQVDDFVVTGCNKYEPVGKKKVTKEQRRNARKAHAGMLTYYIGPETSQKAEVVQFMQIIRGERTPARGKTYTVSTMIKRLIDEPDAEILLEELLEHLKKRPSHFEREIAYATRELGRIRSERLAKEYEHKRIIDSLTEKGIKEGKIKKR